MKLLLSTTAVVLSLSGAAFAQSDMSNGIGTQTYEQSDFMASNLIGMRIYNSETSVDADTTVAQGAETEWEDIGEVNDILLDENGDVKAVILGVGGFLGLGERDVSISMDQIKVLRSDDDMTGRFLVVETSRETLEQAPAFEGNDTGMIESAATQMQNAAESADSTTDSATSDMADGAESSTSTTASDGSNTSDSNTEMSNNANTDRPMLTAPNVEREGYATASAEERQTLTAEDLEGAYVYGSQDETVGEIGSLIMGDDGEVNQVVINVGGFLGLGEKPVAVTWDELQVIRNVEGSDFRIYIDSTEEALEAQPEYQG